MKHESSQRERGQTLLMFVLALGVLMGFVAMAIDIGLLYEDRRHLQNSADAMALAGVAELPLNPVGARLKAEDWAANNDVDSSEIKTIEVRTTDAVNDTLYVEVEAEFSWIFGRVLGQTTSAVGAHAAAQTGSLGPSSNLMPWAIVENNPDCVDALGNVVYGDTCSVKVGAGDGITGWYGALDFDGVGGGSREYEDNIVDGYVETVYCAEGDPTCVGTSTVPDLDGNKVGGTGQGIEERLLVEPTAGCDSNGNDRDDFDEVFASSSTGSSQYTIICRHSPRLIVVPIVRLDGEPVQYVTIEGWALGYLDSYSCVSTSGNCTGKGHWEVQVLMVDAVYAQANEFISASNPLGGAGVYRLIE